MLQLLDTRHERGRLPPVVHQRRLQGYHAPREVLQPPLRVQARLPLVLQKPEEGMDLSLAVRRVALHESAGRRGRRDRRRGLQPGAASHAALEHARDQRGR